MANGLQLAKRKIAPVDKICGPGNAYVAEAKAQLAQSGKVGIDMIAGPSEVLVLADKSSIANSNYIAADLLAQAEHGLTSSALLFTDSDDLAVQVQKEVESQLAKIKRGKEIAQALRACGGIFVVDDLLKDGVPLADDFASEHLEIFCSEQLTQAILTRGICAGAIFIRTGEAFADYGMTGGNHVLPTSRTARFSSGLSARDFVVWQYQEELSNATQEELAEATATFALELESLEAHANAAKVRGR
jgi:histidinol dehydrogenase